MDSVIVREGRTSGDVTSQVGEKWAGGCEGIFTNSSYKGFIWTSTSQNVSLHLSEFFLR